MLGFASSASRRRYPGGGGDDPHDLPPPTPVGGWGWEEGIDGSSSDSSSTMPPGVVNMSEWTALALLASSIGLAAYALVCFLWRSQQFSEWLTSPHSNTNAIRYDDVVGSLSLMAFVVLTFIALILLNLFDLLALMSAGTPGKDGPPVPAGQPCLPTTPYAPDAPFEPPLPPMEPSEPPDGAYHQQYQALEVVQQVAAGLAGQVQLSRAWAAGEHQAGAAAGGPVAHAVRAAARALLQGIAAARQVWDQRYGYVQE